MTIAAQRFEDVAYDTGGDSPLVRAAKRLLRKKIAVVCLIVIVILYGTGALASVVAPYDFADQNLDLSFNGPSWEHPFGTDRTGRDVLSRNIWAMRTTVIVTIATVVAGFFILPVSLGMLAGYRGGWVDAAINRVGEIVASFPGLPMLILINATMRPRFETAVEHVEGWIRWDGMTESGFTDYFLIFFVLSFFGWVGGARLIRSQVIAMRASEFVIAARASGASTPRILWRHIFPNILPLVIVGSSASLGSIAGTEIALTFLGVGVQPPHPSFGVLIPEGASRVALENHPQLLLVPAMIVALLLFAFNLLGDALTDVFTPRTR